MSVLVSQLPEEQLPSWPARNLGDVDAESWEKLLAALCCAPRLTIREGGMRHSYKDLWLGLDHGKVLETVEAKLGAEGVANLCRPSSCLCEKLCVAAMCRHPSDELVQARRRCRPAASGVAAIVLKVR